MRSAWSLAGFNIVGFFSQTVNRHAIRFCLSWVTGILAGSGDRTLAYDSTISGIGGSLGGWDSCLVTALKLFVYPPTILFFTYPLGLMPYVTGFAAWTVVTLLLYVVAIYLIVPRPIAILVALSPFPVFFNIFLGQNGFLLAGLMGLSLALMERRPQLSGFLLGLLTFKPQIGILFPFALLVSRKWCVVAGAVTTSVVLVVVSDVCLRLPIMAVLHPRAGRSRTKSQSDFAAVYAARIRLWLSLVGRHQPAYSLGNTVGCCWCCYSGRVVYMGKAIPSFPESCGPLQRSPVGDAVCAWPRSLHTGDSRRLLG